jgi:hypothetical protein
MLAEAGVLRVGPMDDEEEDDVEDDEAEGER